MFKIVKKFEMIGKEVAFWKMMMFEDIFKQKKVIEQKVEEYQFFLSNGEMSEEATSEERNPRKKWKDNLSIK